ncbi:hypothetical protein [Mesorhizobium sp.]|uniref:hypothetical protein n=1 Tax=Mesorhizobium sp. TaxID=1871066 RepID=UPI0025C2B0E9|nr:hypothetical protein [Mesorhizobium sp.]
MQEIGQHVGKARVGRLGGIFCECLSDARSRGESGKRANRNKKQPFEVHSESSRSGAIVPTIVQNERLMHGNTMLVAQKRENENENPLALLAGFRTKKGPRRPLEFIR